MKRYAPVLSVKTWYTCLLLLVLALAMPATTLAQTETSKVLKQLAPGDQVIIESKNGFVIKGIYKGRSANGIKVDTPDEGEIDVPDVEIAWIEIVDDRIKDKSYIFENPNPTSYLFSSSAISPKKGSGYYRNTYLVLNSFNYGFTDHFSVAAGIELTSAVSTNPTFFVNPKYNFELGKNLRAGVGALYANVSAVEFSGLGIGYGVVTYGNTDDNITVGSGYGFVEKELADRPLFTLSGMKRISRRFSLVSENWLVPTDGYYGVYSYGIRHMGQKVAVDLGFLNNEQIASDVFVLGMPYFSFTINFGR